MPTASARTRLPPGPAAPPPLPSRSPAPSTAPRLRSPPARGRRRPAARRLLGPGHRNRLDLDQDVIDLNRNQPASRRHSATPSPPREMATLPAGPFRLMPTIARRSCHVSSHEQSHFTAGIEMGLPRSPILYSHIVQLWGE